MNAFYNSQKYIAMVALLILYWFNIFSYAFGYSGYSFTKAAIEDSIIYAPLYVIPAACFYGIAAFFAKDAKNKSFYRFQKFVGVAITGVLIFISLVMLYDGSFRSLNFGFWLSVICGLIITFDPAQKTYRQKIQTYFNKPKN